MGGGRRPDALRAAAARAAGMDLAIRELTSGPPVFENEPHLQMSAISFTLSSGCLASCCRKFKTRRVNAGGRGCVQWYCNTVAHVIARHVHLTISCISCVA